MLYILYCKKKTHISMVRSLRKSQCSGFSTSTTPQGYRRPRTDFPLTSIICVLPTMANGMLSCKNYVSCVCIIIVIKVPSFKLKYFKSIYSSKS